MSKEILGYTLIISLDGCISDNECELLTEGEARTRAVEVIKHHYSLNPDNVNYKSAWDDAVESIQDRHCCVLPGERWSIDIVPVYRKSKKGWKPKTVIF